MTLARPPSWGSLDTGDVLAIHELLALYGHCIDACEWQRGAELFMTDALYDMSDFALPVVRGPDAIRALWQQHGQGHPLAHHATNVVVREKTRGIAHVTSKGLGVGRKGRVGSVTYQDIVCVTPAGWRFAERIGTLRRPPPG
ncbi:MAG: nuclear transport factor 2 family protein [Gammaproteobacteria bacterium]|nr:nuclear transport factor 2 family protein [Gammaproteobacteria bacterium]